MGRRRRSSSKRNNKCNICNKLYASRQSLYFHNYTYHKHQTNEINIDNNVEIYHNIDNSDNDSLIELPVENFKGQLDNLELNDHIDNHLINSYIKKINIIKDTIVSNFNNQEKNTDEENKQIVEETKPVEETKQIVEETKPIHETKQIVEETKPVFTKKPISEEKILDDVTLLLNNCIGNNIGISINVELSNSTITVINKLKN